MTNFPNWNPESNTDEIRKLLLERFEEENQPQTDVEQNVSGNTPKGTNNARGNLDFLSYQATLAKAGQGVVYSNSTNNLEVISGPPPLATMINTKDPLSCLSQIWIYGLEELDESQLKVTKRSDGQITDIYYEGVRYGIRYDEQGNIIKTIQQTFDDAENVDRQNVSNWKDGYIANTTMYTYEYDETGKQIGQTRHAIDNKYGSEFKVLNEIFGAGLICSCTLIGRDLQTQRTQDGKITEIMFGGVRYALRYDENGKLVKAFTQEFDESGNVAKQNIKNYNPDGSVKNMELYTYEYDENGQRIGQNKETIPHNVIGVLSQYFHLGFSQLRNIESVNYTNDGKISEVMCDGQRYCFRYDEAGNLTKTFSQAFDEQGRVIRQNVKDYNEDGSVKDFNLYTYEFLDNGNAEGACGVDRVTTQKDKDGNIIQKVLQDLDENGEVKGQNIINYNPDGSEKNRIYYSYSVNEAGEKTQTRIAIDSKYNPTQLLALYGVEYTGEVLSIDGIPTPGQCFDDTYGDIKNIHRNQDGQILEFFYQGKKYSFNYDLNGNVI